MSTGIKLDDFTLAYIECMLWSEAVNLEGDHGIDALHPEAIAAIAEDCERFQDQHSDLLSEADYGTGYYSFHTEDELAGHDFWLTRNGHGTGFFDRDLGPLGDLLTEAAQEFGECHPYIGDDGKIYV